MWESVGSRCALPFTSCLGPSEESDDLLADMARMPVILNVYDMVRKFILPYAHKIIQFYI